MIEVCEIADRVTALWQSLPPWRQAHLRESYPAELAIVESVAAGWFAEVVLTAAGRQRLAALEGAVAALSGRPD